MEMSIDEAINRVRLYAHPYCVCIQLTGEEAQQVSNAIMVLSDTSQKYQMMQADYEARLKADLKAILVDLQLEIEEYKSDRLVDMERDEMARIFSELIQEKINALKENENGNR